MTAESSVSMSIATSPLKPSRVPELEPIVKTAQQLWPIHLHMPPAPAIGIDHNQMRRPAFEFNLPVEPER